MHLSFHGGAGMVTGSNFLLESGHQRVLIDCGLFQGKDGADDRNYAPFLYDASQIDAVILTHAHIDHSGRLPLLHKRGFLGPIYATKGTVDLCRIMLEDSGYIQETETEWLNRKRQRAGKEPLEPIYTVADAQSTLPQFVALEYDTIHDLGEGLRVRLRDAGHILGSAIVELWATNGGKQIKLVFSGDIGNPGSPIVRDPALVEGGDYVIMESTYGDRNHEGREARLENLAEIINRTIARGGNVIIPAFAIERTQELLYSLNKLVEKARIPVLPVYLDSPLAIAATEIFRVHQDYFDAEGQRMVRFGDDPFRFPGLRFTASAEESRTLNKESGAIIISASGMCDAGRVRHHLKHNLWRKESTVLLVGFQAECTLGRRLLEGVRKVRLFGEEITVKADIEYLPAFSAHADRDGLLQWLEGMSAKPGQVLLVHGERQASRSLADLLEQHGYRVAVPKMAERIALESGQVVKPAAIASEVEYPLVPIDELGDDLLALLDDIQDATEAGRCDAEMAGRLEKVARLLQRARQVMSGEL